MATGFDGFCMHRPFEYNDKWRTQTGWYHLDQNGAHKPDRICVQGFVNYYDAGEVPTVELIVGDDPKRLTISHARRMAVWSWCLVRIKSSPTSSKTGQS